MLIQEGRIIKIGRNLNYPQAEIIELEELHVSIGWMDIGASHGDPGAEHREDLQSLRAVAAAGGFTALAPWADTDPCADHKAAIHYLLHGNETSPVEILPIASLSEKGEGKEMADLMDLHTAGAICFSDGMKPIKNAGLLYRSLNYLNAFSGTCIHFPMDFNLVADGQIHEGKWSAMLGLPGIPDVAEDLMVKRDLSILNYTDSKLILWGISSKLALDTLLNEDKLNRFYIVGEEVKIENILEDSEFSNEATPSTQDNIPNPEPISVSIKDLSNNSALDTLIEPSAGKTGDVKI
jgi:dihydroorotase